MPDSLAKALISPAWGIQSLIADSNAKAKAILGPDGQPIDPNAPFSEQLYARKKPTQKLQFMSDTLGIQGENTIDQGTSLLGKPLDYWQKLLEPPTRTSLLEQQAPVVSSVVGQYSTGRKSLAQAPRGGGTNAVAANLPFEESGAITDLLEKQLSQNLNVLQPEAANAITGIAGVLSSLGLSELGISSQDLQALIGAKLVQSGQNTAAAGQAGQGIGAIIASLIAKGAAAGA